MPNTAIRDIWGIMPEKVLKSLLISSSDSDELLNIVEWLLNNIDDFKERDALTHMAINMGLAAWENCVFTPKACSLIRQIHDQTGCLPAQSVAVLDIIQKSIPESIDDIDTFLALYTENDIEKMQVFLERRQKKPSAIFWLRFAMHIGVYNGKTDWLKPWLSAVPIPPALQKSIAADISFVEQNWKQASSLYAASYKAMPSLELLTRQGESRLREGQREEALALWDIVLAKRPWHCNLLLKYYDVKNNLDIPAPHIPSGKGYILLYTWNHGRDLDLALKALAESDLGSQDQCGVIVLDNGSTDTTPEVCKKWQTNLGERLKVITLPVNVGAPAARNWLMALPEVKSADWAIYLDDDAVVPENWLKLLARAMEVYPTAQIYGCRIVDYSSHMALQSIDLNVVLRTGEYKGFDVTCGHISESNFGQYSYMRPASSVTGCCHLLTRKSMDSTGGFDLRFSPSQFDDFERDLRSGLSGDFPIYQGYLEVGHIKRSGSIAGMSNWQKANVEGNAGKLQKSYNTEQISTFINNSYELRLADLYRKIEDIVKCS